MFGLRTAPILIIAVILGFSLAYAPLFSLRMAGDGSSYGNGILDLQTSQPKNEFGGNAAENYARAYNDRISEAIPDSPAAPFLGPILVVSVGLISSAMAYISLRRKIRGFGK